MDSQKMIRLFPLPAQEVPLQGAYLNPGVRGFGKEPGKPLVYANFVQSLDGRIAVPGEHTEVLSVPASTANPRDWRLFQELAAQADVLLTTGRYLRDWHAGRAQEILQVDHDQYKDLQIWRQEKHLPPYPDIAILSASLDFELPDVLRTGERKVTIVTTENADEQLKKNLKSYGAQLICAGQERVDGRFLIEALSKMGYQAIYSAAGPQVLHTLLSAHVLKRLFLTIVPRLLGGLNFATIVEGHFLNPPPSMRLASIFLDPGALNGEGQLFLGYISES